MYMLDTNVIVKAIRGKDHPIREKLLNSYSKGLCISSITYTELLYGVYHSVNPEKNLDALHELLACIEILPFDLSAAYYAGKVMAFLAAKGTPLLIAGHALSLDITLVTHNTREFRRIPDLSVEDWQN